MDRRRIGHLFSLALLIMAAIGTLGSMATLATAQVDDSATAEPDRSVISDSLAFEILRHLAREDTLGIPAHFDYIYGRWVDTEEVRPTLREIIGWCIDNEENKFDSVEDVTFLQRSIALELYGDLGDTTARRVVTEQLEQVYFQKPDRFLTIHLGERTWDSKEEEEDDDDKAAAEVEVRTSGGDLSNLPVFFSQLDEYDFAIEERRILSDRVLYRIGFAPRSEFASLPEGWFLVDTVDYQILRAEYAWTKNVPYPLFIKAIDRVVVDRQRLGEIWYPERVTVVITLRKIPFVPMPRSVELEATIEDVRVNEGIPDSVWTQ